MQKIILYALIWIGASSQLVCAQEGTSCTEAIKANKGINISNNTLGDQWFEYTATVNGKVTVSSVGTTETNTYLEVFDGCELEAFSYSDDFVEKQSEISFEVISGITYYLCWRNYHTNQEFEWLLEESEALQGEFCSNPLLASPGYIVSNIPQNKYRWYEFTASKDGKVIVSSVGNNSKKSSVAVFDDCSYSSSINNDENWNPSIISFNAVEGNKYLICWQSRDTIGSIEWTIEEGKWKAGERCVDPIDIDVSLNNPIDHATATNKWYRYIARKDGEITISSVGETEEDTYLEVYKGCGGQKIVCNDDTDGLQSEIKMDVTSGSVYLIKWDKIFSPKPYSWSLKSDMISTDMPDEQQNELNVYPNPTSGFVNVDLSGYDADIVKVKVMTTEGSLVNYMELLGGVVTNVDVSNLATGIYNIVFEDLVSQKVIKLLKQ